MFCRSITTSFSFNNYTSKVTSKASSGICLIKPPWGQSLLWQVCQYQNAQDRPDTTNAITPHLPSSLASLSTRVAWKCYMALTAAAPGTVTSSHSHSTQTNLACLFTDLPSDLNFDWGQNYFAPSFFKQRSGNPCQLVCINVLFLFNNNSKGSVWVFSLFFFFTKYIL